MLLNFRKMIAACIFYLILLNLFCFSLNRHSYVKRLKRNKKAKENCIDENTIVAQIKEPEVADNLSANTFDVQNNQYDKSNLEDDDFELKGYTKHKDDNTQPKNKRIDSLIIAKGIRKTTIQPQPESSSNIYIYINGNLDEKRTVWCWSCLCLLVSIMVMVILLKFFYYNFDLGFYYVNPERTE